MVDSFKFVHKQQIVEVYPEIINLIQEFYGTTTIRVYDQGIGHHSRMKMIKYIKALDKKYTVRLSPGIRAIRITFKDDSVTVYPGTQLSWDCLEMFLNNHN